MPPAWFRSAERAAQGMSPDGSPVAGCRPAGRQRKAREERPIATTSHARSYAPSGPGQKKKGGGGRPPSDEERGSETAQERTELFTRPPRTDSTVVVFADCGLLAIWGSEGRFCRIVENFGRAGLRRAMGRPSGTSTAVPEMGVSSQMEKVRSLWGSGRLMRECGRDECRWVRLRPRRTFQLAGGLRLVIDLAKLLRMSTAA